MVGTHCQTLLLHFELAFEMDDGGGDMATYRAEQRATRRRDPAQPRWSAHPTGVALQRARAGLAEAAAAETPDERFRLAHLAALRTAAAVLADRGRPASARRRLVSAWLLIEAVAPEYREWAELFAAGAASRAAIEAGARDVVSGRAADDELRAAGEFWHLVAGGVGGLRAPLAS